MKLITACSAIFISFFFATNFASAQQPNPFGAQAPLGAGAKKRPTPLSSEKAVRVIYGSSAWNKDPKAIDSASVILREDKTDKLLQIFLEETEPDSSVFSGLYTVRWENVQKLAPEFYVAPEELRGKFAEIRELKNLIKQKKITKKPYIFRRIGKQQYIEIYDTGEQAKLAYEAFAAEKAALELTDKKILNESTYDANQLAETVARRKASAKAQQERVRLAQIEAQKRANQLRELSKLSQSERERRKAEAARLAAEALREYKEGNFKAAEENFSKATELDPQNTTFYFQYGVTVYKLDQANRAIVLMNMAADSPSIAAEKPYYLGLAYLKVQDSQNALTSFSIAAKTSHPDIAPSSEFYRGMIFVELKKYDEAQQSFQLVLDTSKDPKLDEKAEEMIERLQQLRRFEAEKAKRWSASALLGEMYDSNVLQISDTVTTGGATDLIGYRTIFAGGVKYRPLYDEHREFAATLDTLIMYTVDENFKQQAQLREADPTLITATTPYTIKSVFVGRGNKLDIRPGYEMLMSGQEDGAQKPILHSGFLTFDDVMIWNDKNLAIGKFELRYDDSQLESSVGDQDATAFKTKLFLGNLKFLSPDRTKMLTSELGFTLNSAVGKDMTYERYDLNVGYIAPWLWDVTYNAKLSYYYLTYPKQTANRVDNDIGLTLAGSKKINAVLTGGLTATYNRNISNVVTYDYSKYTIMGSVSANWDF